MTHGYARIDLMLPAHPKIRQLSDSAFRLHISAICWTELQRSGGHILAGDLCCLSDVRRPGESADQLVQAGLWEATGYGWKILEYIPGTPQPAKVERERKAGVVPFRQRDPV